MRAPIACPWIAAATAPDPPMIATASPPIGAREADPAEVRQIAVTSDQAMATTGWSWTGRGRLCPETTGRPRSRARRTCALLVSPTRGRFHRVGISSTSHQSVTGGGDTFPPVTGEFGRSEDMRTLSSPVAPQPDHECDFGVNSFSHINFQTDHGVPVPWTRVRFHTRPAP